MDKETTLKQIEAEESVRLVVSEGTATPPESTTSPTSATPGSHDSQPAKPTKAPKAPKAVGYREPPPPFRDPRKSGLVGGAVFVCSLMFMCLLGSDVQFVRQSVLASICDTMAPNTEADLTANRDLAETYLRIGQTTKAQDVMRRMTDRLCAALPRSSPLVVSAELGYAYTLRMQPEHEQAVKSLTQSALSAYDERNIERDVPDTATRLARRYDALGDRTTAAKLFRIGLLDWPAGRREENPMNVACELARNEEAIGNKKYALDLYQWAYRRSDGNMGAKSCSATAYRLQQLGRLCNEFGTPEQAQFYLEKSLWHAKNGHSAAGDVAVTRRELAKALTEQFKFADAVPEYRAAIEQFQNADPGNGESAFTYYQLARCYKEMKNTAAAKDAAETAWKLAREHSQSELIQLLKRDFPEFTQPQLSGDK